MKSIVAVCCLFAAAGAVGRSSCRERPRTAYSRHVYECAQCSCIQRTLCPEGERLRKAAAEDDGLFDPHLDQ